MPKKSKGSIFEKEKDSEIVAGREQFLDESEEHAETSDELEAGMRAGSDDVDVYSAEGRDELVEEDEVAGWEEGFSEGERNQELSHCAHCGRVIGQEKQKIIELVRNHTRYAFCSPGCAKKGVVHGLKKKED